MSPLTDALWPRVADTVALAALSPSHKLAILAVWCGVAILAGVLFDGGNE